MTTARKIERLPIPGYPDYEVSTKGEVEGPYGRVEVENLLGSKAYILYRKDGTQFLVRPSELIQRAFPDISDEEAMQFDRFHRTADKVRNEITELNAYYDKRRTQLTEELDRILMTSARSEEVNPMNDPKIGPPNPPNPTWHRPFG